MTSGPTGWLKALPHIPLESYIQAMVHWALYGYVFDLTWVLSNLNIQQRCQHFIGNDRPFNLITFLTHSLILSSTLMSHHTYFLSKR